MTGAFARGDLATIAEVYFAAWERGDPSAIAALHAPD